MGKDLRAMGNDDVIDAYVEWRKESAQVEFAYRRWSIASVADRALAFAAYLAALDREELATRSYAEVARRGADPSRLRDAA